MTDFPRSDVDQTTIGTVIGAEVKIALLRAAGAAQFDPNRLHHLSILANRSRLYPANVKDLLEAKLNLAVVAFENRFADAQAAARAALSRSTRVSAAGDSTLEQLFASGDFKGLHRILDQQSVELPGLTLELLTGMLAQPVSGKDNPPRQSAVQLPADDPAELKTLRHSRSSWSRLSTDNLLARALAQAPKNAGPINSHMLVLRSLSLMHESAPAYLNCFLSYTDTLLRLDQTGQALRTPVKKAKKTRTRNSA